MKKVMKGVVIAGIVAMLCAVSAYGAVKPTTIAGFINHGDKSYDHINIMLSKQLISLLSKLPGVVITPWEEVEKWATNNAFWQSEKIDPDLVLACGSVFDTKQVVVGEYKVDKATEKMTITLYVYDVMSGEVKIKRDYEGDAGSLDIFDTIDRIIKNVSFLLVGQAVTLVKLKLTTDETNQYLVALNGRKDKTFTKGAAYDSDIPVKMETEVTIFLVSGKSELEVFRQKVTPLDDNPVAIAYKPMGAIQVKAIGYPGAVVYLNGEKIGEANENGDYSLNNLPANQEQSVKVMNKEKLIGEYRLRVREGEAVIQIAGEKSRFLFFPVKAMPIGVSAGISYYPLNFLYVELDVGFQIVPSELTFVPIIDLNAMYEYPLSDEMRIAGGLSVMMHIAGEVTVSPAILGRFDWNKIFVEAGLRFSFNTNKLLGEPVGYPKLLLMAGYRF